MACENISIYIYYIKNSLCIVLTSTMGPGIRLNVAKLVG